MRALTMEEVGWVAGGDATGDKMQSYGETMIIWSTPVSALPKVGKPLGRMMLLVGGALVAQGNQWNQSHPGGGGSSGGEGNPGGPGGPGSGGGPSGPDPGNHGGVGGGSCSGGDSTDGNGKLSEMVCTPH